MIDFIEYYKTRGHVFGECMSHPDTNFMYINIPKNASSWTKLNLKDLGWEFYNYHTDNLYHKHALIVLRDPVERWLSGIAEYMSQYHANLDAAHISLSFMNLIFERVAFDDHTDLQVLFLQNINLDNCTFIKCDQDYRVNFSNFLSNREIPNLYSKYDYQHVSSHDTIRTKFKNIFKHAIEKEPKYRQQLQQYFNKDYKLIKLVEFYGTS